MFCVWLHKKLLDDTTEQFFYLTIVSEHLSNINLLIPETLQPNIVSTVQIRKETERKPHTWSHITTYFCEVCRHQKET